MARETLKGCTDLSEGAEVQLGETSPYNNTHVANCIYQCHCVRHYSRPTWVWGCAESWDLEVDQELSELDFR